MYHPTTRVLTVLELLQAHGRISGPELAARLEVNIRTVRHYITLLQDLGIPIEAERGRTGGYRLRAGFKLPPLMFTEDEALALTLGLLTARRLGLTSTAPAVEGALAKVERVMPDALRARIQAVQASLVIANNSESSAPSSSLVLLFSSAVQQQQRIMMGYRNWSDSETERALDPYGVVFFDGKWYVVGYCHLRTGLRIFRLDRVLWASLTDIPFERPHPFDSLAYVMQSLANAPANWEVAVLLETTIQQAQNHVPPSMAVLETHEDGVLMRCNTQNLHWLAHFLLGLNVTVRVLYPPQLRDAFRDIASRAASFAEQPLESEEEHYAHQ